MAYKIEDNLEKKITLKQSYEAMYGFLHGYYELTKNPAIGDLLSYLSTTDSGFVVDQGLGEDWFKAVEKALKGEVDTRLILTKEE